MDEIKSIVEEYFTQHPINVDEIIADYKANYQTKILDDKTGQPFRLGVDDSKLYIIEKQILTQEVI